MFRATIRAAGAAVLLSVMPFAAAQTTYSVFVDTDGSATSGCELTYPGGIVRGAEVRFDIPVTLGAAPQVGQVRQSTCSAGSFVPGPLLGSPYVAGTNNGLFGSDVIEMQAVLTSLPGLASGSLRLAVVAEGGGASDVLLTTTGAASGAPILLSIPMMPIPTMGALGLVLLGALVMVAGLRKARRSLRMVLAGGLLLASGVVLATSFVVDGQVNDWSGATPLATDPAGDPTNASVALDLRALFGAIDGGMVTLRIDVADLQNRPPVANAQAVTLLEDAAPTVITLTGTDPEAAPLTFMLGTAPTLGTLGPLTPTGPASATVTYTPNANANGTDGFSFRVDDGVLTSPDATVAITVTAVNDAPSFTAGTPPAVNEDAGAQAIANWASFNPGPPDEASQTATYLVSAVGNAALFSTPPAVSPNGTLTYTPAANANGTSTFTVAVRDSGGTANGGIDTSPPQTFTITVNAINDAPSFTVGPNQTIDEDAGAQTVNPWATAISAGPPDEAAQTLTFNVTGNTNAALFSTAPAVAANGTLSYTPAADANGTATITLTLSDSGPGAPPPNANTSPSQTFTVTVNAVNDAPVNTVPGAQTTGDTIPLVFSNANGNAISVADADAGTGLVRMSFATGAATNGTLSLANPGGVLATLAGNGTATVVATGTITALNTALNGPGGGLTYTPVAGTSAARTITVSTDDQGNTGSGGAQVDTDTITVNVDAPPIVTSTPATGATIAENAAITLSFSEPVNVAAGITFTCTGGTVSNLGGTTGSNVSALNLSYTGVLGGTCTLTVPAASVTDVDTIDPPDNPVADYVATFTVDEAPTVTSTTPTNGSTTANDVALQITFSEPVNATNAVTLTCGGPNLITGGATGTAVNVLNPTYAGSLPSGACTLTVLAANVVDSDAIDPPDHLPADLVVDFTVDAAPAFVSSVPAADGAVVGTGQFVTFNFDEPVANLGGAITLDCGGNVAGTITGDGTTALTFTPSAALTAGASCTAIAVAAEIGDSDAFDPPQNPVADVVRTFTVDAAPTITGILPANGATDVGLASNIVVSFSEPVSFTAAAFTLACPNGNPVAFTVSGSGTGTATIDPTPATLPINTLCRFTVDMAQVTDVDTADPPNAGNGVTTVDFTTVNDQPPSVTASTPAPGATVANNGALSISFSEPVNATAGSVTLTCGGPNLITGGTAGSGVSSLAPTYTAPLPSGASCTLTVLAANITDADAIDPPDGMVADYVANFTVDAAPAVTTVSPDNNATGVATNTTLTVNFSEPVDIAAGGITLDCGGPISFGAGLPASNVTSIVLTPTAPLPTATTCLASVIATLVSDVDSIDPPDRLTVNENWTFTTVDAAPSVTGTTPTNGAANVDPTGTITISFSEPVNFSTAPNAANTSFDLECPAGTPADFTVVTASPASSVVLNPLDSAIAGRTCTLIVRAAGITDADAIDPPDDMVADFTAGFGFGGIAVADGYQVTPHLTLAVPISGIQGGGVLANDLVGGGSVTGFGFAPACTGTSPGSQLDAGAANGRLTLNADGSFVYQPPAGVANATRTFCYTVTGGLTANIDFNLENTELVWFVDAAAAAGGTGTQARPFNALVDAASADTTNDTIYMVSGNYTAGIALEVGTRLIGAGASGTLAAITGITPVAGSAFPSLGGTAPTLSCAGTCVQLPSGGNNTLRGFTIGDSGATGTDLAGTGFGTLTASQITLSGTGRAMNLENGTVDATITSIESTSGAQNLRLVQLAGSLTVSGNTLLSGAAGTALDIRNSTVNLSLLGAANSLTAPAGIGIFCQNAGLSASFTTLSAAGGSNGLSFDGCTGTINAAGGSLGSTAGVNNHVVNIVNTSGTSAVSLTYGGTINKTTQGRAVYIDGLTGPAGAATFTGPVTASNLSSGIAVQNTSRPVTFTTLNLGSPAARFTTTPVTLEGNTGAVGLGNVAIYTTGATGLDITYANASPGQVSSGPNSLIDAGGAAVALNVDHATQQPLALQFTSITSTGAGAHGIVVNRASGSLAVSARTEIGAKTTAAIEISNSNNFAVSFGEVDITGATGDGVRLTNNGAGSSFTILGDGDFATVHTNGAGGTWTNLGGSAFNIDGARDIRVTDLTITGVGNHGVNGRGIVNLLFSNVDMSNVGNADNEHVFNLREGEVGGAPISGDFEVNHSVIENFTDNGVYLENFAGTLNFRWTNNILRNNLTTTACGGGNCNGNGILLRADGTSRINALIASSTFERIDGIGLSANPEGNSGARLDINVAQSAFTAETYGGPSNTNNGETAISLRNAQGNSTMNFRLISNDVRNYTGELALGVVEIEGGDFTATNGVIEGLFIAHAHEGNALQIFADGQNTTSPGATTNLNMNVRINALNVPTGAPIFGASVLLQNNGAISGSTVNGNYSITNSNLLANAIGSSRRTITANVRDYNNACVDIRNNTVAAGTGGTQPAINLSYNGFGAVRLQGMVGSGDANAIAYLGANNTLAVPAVSGPNNNVTGAVCAPPSLPVTFPFD